MHDGAGGEVVLREKYFSATAIGAKIRKIRLVLPGLGLAFELDHDQVVLQRKKRMPPLFCFLDDTAKSWSKRCDFVNFYGNGRAFHADCIEFKSKEPECGQDRASAQSRNILGEDAEAGRRALHG